MVEGACGEVAGPQFADLKLQNVSRDKHGDSSAPPGAGLWRVSPITDADENDDEGDDEDDDVQRCVCVCLCLYVCV